MPGGIQAGVERSARIFRELHAFSAVRSLTWKCWQVMEPFRPKYQWRRVEAESQEGFDGNVLFGRVARNWKSGPRQWRWEGGLDPRIKMIVKPYSGSEDGEMDAVATAEAHYESCLRLNGLTERSRNPVTGSRRTGTSETPTRRAARNARPFRHGDA